MKIIPMLLVFLFMPVMVSLAQENYPVSLELVNETLALKTEWSGLTADILKALKMQPSEAGLRELSTFTLGMGRWLMGLNYMLLIESYHGAESQYNIKSLEKIQEYMQAITRDIDLLSENCIILKSKTKNPTIFSYADKAKNLFNKTRELMFKITTEFLDTNYMLKEKSKKKK